MGLIEFNKLPVNTLVGADWRTFKNITAGRTIDKGYRGKYALTKGICRLMSLFAPCKTAVMPAHCKTNHCNTTLCLSLGIGAAVPHLCTTSWLATSTSATAQPIKLSSRTS